MHVCMHVAYKYPSFFSFMDIRTGVMERLLNTLSIIRANVDLLEGICSAHTSDHDSSSCLFLHPWLTRCMYALFEVLYVLTVS